MTQDKCKGNIVAPRAGAWVETSRSKAMRPITPSHPVRVRGLKLGGRWSHAERQKSHPVRVRGLKRGNTCIWYGGGYVAPRAGAWVETLPVGGNACGSTVAPRAGAWVETEYDLVRRPLDIVAPRAGAWVETCAIWWRAASLWVAPRAGAWVET